MRPAFRIAALVLSVSLCGCANADATWVELGGKRYSVEVADDDAERVRGLMFRDAMPVDHGMLFIHDREEPLAYWMKNTKIALDILYFDRSLALVSQQRDVPPCSAGNACPVYPSGRAARYVLELNAGEAERLGLADGARLRLSPALQDAP